MFEIRAVFIAICTLVLIKTGEPFDRFMNYSSVLGVNDFSADADTLWVATSGGLYGHHRTSGKGILYSDPSFFPDPCITALFRDPNGTLWIGSSNGYLYKRPRQGRQSVINSYFIAHWRITDIEGYGKYLIIGSDKGCSVFDTEKLTAIKNASNFGNAFTDPRVNALLILRDGSGSRDSLLLGCIRGIAKMPVTEKILKEANFYDPSLWTVDTADTMTVRAFARYPGGYRALARPGASFLKGIVSSDTLGSGGIVSYDSGGTTLTLPSMIAAVSVDGPQCFIGTTSDCFYIWDGTNAWYFRIPGPRFSMVNRIAVDREGIVWVCPRMTSGSRWWEGISAFQNGEWQLYNRLQYPLMGWLGEGIIQGVAEDCLGGMWFGTHGGSVKRFNRQNAGWFNYYIFGYSGEPGTDKFFSDTTYSGITWAKSDAIAGDSSGFLWIGVYRNVFGDLLCYDPRREPDPKATDYKTAGYRRFSPEEGDVLHTSAENKDCWITSLCVDPANTVIAGYLKDKIVTFSHDGNPLEHGIREKYTYKEEIGRVYDAASTPDTLTRLATSTFFRTLDPRRQSLTVLDSSLTEVVCVEAEDAQTLWLGTLNNGLIRYDLLNRKKTFIDETAGLLSNHVQDISIDRKGGYLWIASDRGVSRYTLGYSVGSQNTGTPLVFPNPFSKRRHKDVVFEKLPAASKVRIYTAAGSLVATLSPESGSVSGAVCVWKPPREIVPGIYLYTVRSGSKGKQGKFIVTP